MLKFKEKERKQAKKTKGKRSEFVALAEIGRLRSV